MYNIRASYWTPITKTKEDVVLAPSHGGHMGEIVMIQTPTDKWHTAQCFRTEDRE